MLGGRSYLGLINGLRSSWIPALSYSICSITMIFTNKLLVSLYCVKAQLSLMLLQNLVAWALVSGARSLGFITYPAFRRETAAKWFPISILFVGMLYTNMQSLSYLSVATVTVVKNVTNVVIYYGDRYLFGRLASDATLFSLFLMTLGAILNGYSDLEFVFIGYFWLFLNCLCTAGYVLLQSFARQSIEEGDVKLGEFGQIAYNSLLSLPLILLMALFTDELSKFDGIRTSQEGFKPFLIVNLVAGFCLSYSSFWLIQATSATTYSIMGALNKIPLTILSLVFFPPPYSSLTIPSIVLGLGGGIVFALAKIQQAATLMRHAMSSKV